MQGHVRAVLTPTSTQRASDQIWGDSSSSLNYDPVGVTPHPGNDLVYGGLGNDCVRGGRGRDVVDAGPGIDVLWAVQRGTCCWGGPVTTCYVGRVGPMS
jgi:Ca2+-binding RTX toxin-like protein